MRIHNCGSELFIHIYVVMGSNHAPIVFILIKVFSFSYRHAILIYILIMCVCVMRMITAWEISLGKFVVTLKGHSLSGWGWWGRLLRLLLVFFLCFFCCATAIMNDQSMKLDMTIAIFALPEVVKSWIVAVPPHCLEDFTKWALP